MGDKGAVSLLWPVASNASWTDPSHSNKTCRNLSSVQRSLQQWRMGARIGHSMPVVPAQAGIQAA